MLHGLGLSQTIWGPLANIIEGPAITPDLPGFGAQQTTGYQDIEQCTTHIVRCMNDYNWSNTVLVVHSLASGLLSSLLAKTGQHPRAIILLEGNLLPIDATWSHDIIAMDTQKYASWARRYKKNAALILRTQLQNKHPAEEIGLWAEGFTQFDHTALPQYAADALQVIKSGQVLQTLAALHDRVLYLRGAESPEWDEGRTLLTKHGIKIAEIAKAAHFPMLDNPCACAEEMTKHLQSCPVL